MKIVLVIFFASTFVFAARTSQWSPFFTLTENVTAIQKDRFISQSGKNFDIVVTNMRHSLNVNFMLTGIDAKTSVSFKIYSVNGKQIADLSRDVNSGTTSFMWKRPFLQSGLFFANLQNGKKTKIVKFVFVK